MPRRSHSPLLSALHPGAGRGRLSTLEAVAAFHGEAGLRAHERALRAALGVLTARVAADREAASPSHAEDGGERDAPPEWVGAMRAAAARACARAASSAGDAVAVVPQPVATHREGLRRCAVCGAALASSLRMAGHLTGARHCGAVARAAFASEAAAGRPSVPGARELDALFEELSSAVLRAERAEPPDAAVARVLRGAHEAKGLRW